jgi:hypothetical protein
MPAHYWKFTTFSHDSSTPNSVYIIIFCLGKTTIARIDSGDSYLSLYIYISISIYLYQYMYIYLLRFQMENEAQAIFLNPFTNSNGSLPFVCLSRRSYPFANELNRLIGQNGLNRLAHLCRFVTSTIALQYHPPLSDSV